MIINIEGTDGSGKQTQTKLLYDYLTSLGKKCKMMSFPNYANESSIFVKKLINGDLGTNLESYQTSCLYAVDRLVTLCNENFDEYDYVLFDRYVPSNFIHQSVKIQDMTALNNYLEYWSDFEYNKLKLPKPDKILFLDVPVEISLKLANARTELKSGQKNDIFENESHLRLAYERAKYVANKFEWTSINCCKDGSLKTIEEIHKSILNALGL